MTTTTTSSSLSSSSEQDPLRDAVLKEFTEAGYTDEEIQTVLAQQDALRRRKDDDADSDSDRDDGGGDKKEEPASWTKVPRKYVLPSTLDAYHLPWQFDETDEESIIITKWVSTELLDEIFEHTRRARQDNHNIRSSNPPGGRYGRASSRRTPQANYSSKAGYVQHAGYPKSSNMRQTGIAVYDDTYEYADYGPVRIKEPSRSAAQGDWIYTA
ncbi:uncharacterized protein BDW70DRAFT_53444 [Aspergillus foveolatus]|uniref:uncharacterized protein n=1 Tax=Aspergillus foveolatus TaxID=210207 RepID=UPI003CCD72FE